MSLEHNLVAKRNTKAVTRLVLIRVVFGIGIIQIGTGWRRGRANHLVVVVIILLFLVVIMWWRWRRSDEGGVVMEGRRRGRVFGGTNGMKPFLGRGRDGRKIVGGFGIGNCRRSSASGVVNGFERGLRFGLLTEGKREFSSNAVVYFTFFLHSFSMDHSITTTALF
jgi:hypothetical protein